MTFSLAGRIRQALVAGLALAAAAATLASQPDPDRMPLSGGGALVLTRRDVQLLDPRGVPLARWTVRGEQLDARASDGAQGIALVIDKNAERVVPLRFDAGGGTLTALEALPAPRRGVAASCLYRDAQGLLHAFVLSSSGLAQQWWLPDQGPPRLVREFAAAPDAGHCRTDDGRDRLFVSEPGGVWLHRAEPEGDDAREVVALRRPHGPLRQGGGVLVVGRDAVSVRDGQRVQRFRVRSRALSKLPVVAARVQTAPVAQAGDAADDPAIWVHPSEPASSLVLATDKKRGLAVYDLQGLERQFLPVGRINNVDVRQDLLVGGQRMDLAAATQRDEHGLVVFGIDADRRVTELARLPVGYKDIYGLCMRRTPQGEPEVFVNDKDGRILQLRLERDQAGTWSSRRLREFRVASQPEACVVDDARNLLFMGEERRGVWALSADPGDAQAGDRRLVLPVGGLLQADVEGLALYRGGGRDYLVVSSQGNDSYVVLDATPPHRVWGAFRIGINVEQGLDGASETDGLDITSVPLGPGFEQGLLVVQDGRKRLPEGAQNFKYVGWREVTRALGLP